MSVSWLRESVRCWGVRVVQAITRLLRSLIRLIVHGALGWAVPIPPQPLTQPWQPATDQVWALLPKWEVPMLYCLHNLLTIPLLPLAAEHRSSPPPHQSVTKTHR